jgi:signal transduction histidine kinase
MLRCRDGSVVEVAVHEAEIVAAGRRVGTLYELRPPDGASADEARRASARDRAGLETAGVVHDLNNLLTVVAGHVELLAEELAPEVGAPTRLGPLQQATEGAATLARRLLEIARGIETGRTRLDPAELAAGAIALVGAAPASACEIALDAEPALPAILGDRLQLEQVLLNLLLNAEDSVAARYTQSERTAPPIEVRVAVAAGGAVALEVRDRGAGIAADARARIFEPHFTTKPNGAGSGLGLATASAMVAAHGGRIEVESTPGAGATFTVLLPAAETPG